MNQQVGIALISAIVCAATCGCIGPAESPRSVEAIADEYLAAYLERHPECREEIHRYEPTIRPWLRAADED